MTRPGSVLLHFFPHPRDQNAVTQSLHHCRGCRKCTGTCEYLCKQILGLKSLPQPSFFVEYNFWNPPQNSQGLSRPHYCIHMALHFSISTKALLTLYPLPMTTHPTQYHIVQIIKHGIFFLFFSPSFFKAKLTQCLLL